MLSPFDPHATVADFTYADGKGFVVRVRFVRAAAAVFHGDHESRLQEQPSHVVRSDEFQHPALRKD
jgi:hypothetical protein